MNRKNEKEKEKKQERNEKKQFNGMKKMLNRMNDGMNGKEKAELRMKNNISNRNCLIEKFSV